MTDDAASNALLDEFARAWDMVLAAVRSFPDETWRTGSEERFQPARLAYHLLLAANRYTWLGAADDYMANRRFTLNWAEAPVDAFPGRESALELLERAKADTIAWIESQGAGLVGEKAMWPWTGESALAQGIYHLRHLQHHMAELNMELRRRGLQPIAWR